MSCPVRSCPVRSCPRELAFENPPITDEFGGFRAPEAGKFPLPIEISEDFGRLPSKYRPTSRPDEFLPRRAEDLLHRPALPKRLLVSASRDSGAARTVRIWGWWPPG